MVVLNATLSLNDLLVGDNHSITIYCGYYPPGNGTYPREIRKRYKNMNLVCFCFTTGWAYNTNAELNRMFNEYSQFDDLRIYFSTFMCWPHVISPCISVCHGVYWDYTYGPNKFWKPDEIDEFWRQNLYGFTQPDLVVSVDANSKNVIAAVAPGEQRKMVVIPNFVDTTKFVPGHKTWDGIRVLFPRRMTLIRGSNHFNKAAQDLPQHQFIACGQAINENEEKQFTKTFHRQIPNLLQMWLPADDMPDLYKRADIAVIPTVASEGTSLGAIESMSCALPVIASNVGGLQQLVIDGTNGLVFDPDHDVLSEKIQVLAEDESLRAKFAKRNREMAIDSFSIERWKSRWREIIPPARGANA